MNDNIGINNKRVWIPKTEKRLKRTIGMTSPTPTERIYELSKNAKTQMHEEKFSYLTRDPEN